MKCCKIGKAMLKVMLLVFIASTSAHALLHKYGEITGFPEWKYYGLRVENKMVHVEVKNPATSSGKLSGKMRFVDAHGKAVAETSNFSIAVPAGKSVTFNKRLRYGTDQSVNNSFKVLWDITIKYLPANIIKPRR